MKTEMLYTELNSKRNGNLIDYEENRARVTEIRILVRGMMSQIELPSLLRSSLYLFSC